MNRTSSLLITMFAVLMSSVIRTSAATTAATRPPVGRLDGVIAGVVWGWAYDPDAPSASIDVHLYIDGAIVAGIRADRARPDVNQAFGISRNHGFSLTLPARFRDGQRHLLAAYGIDTGGGVNPQLTGSPRTFTWTTLPPVGCFDVVTDGTARGWTYDPDPPAAAVTVHFYLDGPAGGGGTFIGAVPANLPRPDVNAALGIPGDHGWAYPIPAHLLSAPHTLHAYALDTTGGINPLLTGSPKGFGAGGYAKLNPQPVYVHYMPWFTTADYTGHWVSHYAPLIGRYNGLADSVLKYHALLIKASGIDGIIFDWYGTSGKWDYPEIHARTMAMKAVCDEVGLKYAICYEDRTVQDNGWAAQAAADFAHLSNRWFSSGNYLRLDGRSIVLNFGPIVLKNNNEWTNILAAGNNPRIFFLEGHRGMYGLAVASGEFAWVNECGSVGGLQYWYDHLTGGDAFRIGAALPRYRDVYGAHAPINPGGDPNYLTDLLNAANGRHAAIIQIATFNDYGEGTMVEPTVQDQYAFLQRIQAYTGINKNLSDLQTVKRFYDRYAQTGYTGAVQSAYSHLKAGNFAAAAAALN